MTLLFRMQTCSLNLRNPHHRIQTLLKTHTEIQTHAWLHKHLQWALTFFLCYVADNLARSVLLDPTGLVVLKNVPQGEEHNVVISSAISGLPWFKNNSLLKKSNYGLAKIHMRRSQFPKPCPSMQWSTDPDVFGSLSLMSRPSWKARQYRRINILCDWRENALYFWGSGLLW